MFVCFFMFLGGPMCVGGGGGAGSSIWVWGVKIKNKQMHDLLVIMFKQVLVQFRLRILAKTWLRILQWFYLGQHLVYGGIALVR